MTRICIVVAIVCIVGVIYSYQISGPVHIQVQELKIASTAGAIVFLLLGIVGYRVKYKNEDEL